MQKSEGGAEHDAVSVQDVRISERDRQAQERESKAPRPQTSAEARADLADEHAEGTAQLQAAKARRDPHQFAERMLLNLEEGVVYDRYLRFAAWSPLMEELTGLSAADVVGEHCLDLFPSFCEQGVHAMLTKVLTGQTFSAVETFLSSPRGGRPVWVISRFTPLRDDAGELVGVVATSHDITERKRTEESLLQNHNLLRAVVEGTTDAVFVKDRRGRYVMINRAGARFLGKTIPEVIGRDDSALFPPSEARQVIEDDRSIMESGQTRTLEEVCTAGGVTRTYLATKWPWRDVRGQVIGLIGISRDVTERRRADDEVRESQRRYEDLVNSIDGVVWEADSRTIQFSFVSKQAERLTGYPARNWLDQMDFWKDHLHPDDRERTAALLTKAVEERSPQNLEYRMIRADGTTVWLRDNVTVVVESGQAAKLRGVMVDVTGRKEAEQALHASEQRLRTVVSNVPIILFALDRDGIFTLSEGRGLEAFGRAPGDRVGASLFELYGGAEEITSCFRRALSGETIASNVEVAGLAFDAWCGPLRDDSDAINGVIGVATDVTEYRRGEAARKSLEQQLLQAQKMESIGRLAGGVAHDFNNLLTAIIGYAQLLLGRIEEDHPLRKETEEILEAGYKAAGLTSQLLAFSRCQELVRKNIDLNDTILTFTKMLRRVIGEDIDLRFIPDMSLPLVNADAGQIEQVLMNIAVNARDAMPEGGRLIVETQEARMDDDYCRVHPWARPGRYAVIKMNDTGVGMDPETQQHIFEPFFTTKDQSKGTGLGLSVVYGIIEQHQGLIHVYSQEGFGTAFSVYLPLRDELVDSEERPAQSLPLEGSETILLAEDEPALRNLAKMSLRELGYRPLLAGDGEEALRLYEANSEQIDLVVLDWVMPKMGGFDAYRQLRTRFGRVPVVFVTGYSGEMVNLEDFEDGRVSLLQKPYGVSDLAQRVREALDQAKMQEILRLC